MNDKHCDEYIDDSNAPKCLRVFLLIHRMPATNKHLLLSTIVSPELYAMYEGYHVRVVMASRQGHVGITRNLKSDIYTDLAYISGLSHFTSCKPVYDSKKVVCRLSRKCEDTDRRLLDATYRQGRVDVLKRVRDMLLENSSKPGHELLAKLCEEFWTEECGQDTKRIPGPELKDLIP